MTFSTSEGSQEAPFSNGELCGGLSHTSNLEQIWVRTKNLLEDLFSSSGLEISQEGVGKLC